MAVEIQGVPNITQTFTDGRGYITQAWRQFLISLWSRTGGSSGGGLVNSVNGMTGDVEITLYELGAEHAAIDYGIVADGVTNNLAAWNLMVADVNAGFISCIRLPPGVILINGDPDPFTRGTTLRGCGVKHTIIQDAGGTSTMFQFNALPPGDSVGLYDFSMNTNQVEARSAVEILWNNTPAGFNVHLTVNNLEIRSTGATGWANGIHVHNCILGRYIGMTINGRRVGTSAAGVSNMGNAIHITADPGYYSVGQFFTQCSVIAANMGLRVEDHCEGIYWYGCDIEFCRNAMNITLSDTTNAPSFIVSDAWMEFYEQGIVVTNASRVIIRNNEMLKNANGTTANCHFVLVSDSIGVEVVNNEMAASDPLGIGTNGVAFSNVNQGLSQGNQISGSRATGVVFTGTTQACHSVNDQVNTPLGSGIACDNNGANATTNSFRGMRSNTFAHSQTLSFTGAVGFAPGVPGTSMGFMGSPMRVVVGEQYRVTLLSSQTSVSANQVQGLTVREYNHRPAAPSPYTVFNTGANSAQITDAKAAFSATSARFNVENTFRVVAAANDAWLEVLLNTDTGTSNCASMSAIIERL